MSSPVDLVDFPSRTSRWRAAAVAVAFVAFVAGLVFLQLRPDAGEVASGPPAKGPVLVVVGTEVVDVSVSPPATFAELPEDAGTATQAVLTDSGLLVSTQRPLLSQLLLVPIDGSPHRVIATDPSAFAVDATGTRFAWAVSEDDGSSSDVFEASLSDPSAAEVVKFDRHVSVVGYAQELIVLTTGKDPAGHNAPPALTAAAVWDPHGGVTVLSSDDGPYWSAIGTDPSAGVAVLTEGDGECKAIVEVPSMRRRNQGRNCTGIPYVAKFSPSGKWLAVAPGDSFEGLEVYTAEGVRVATGPPVEGPVAWTSEDSFVALVQGGSTIERCDVRPGRDSIECEALWTYVPEPGVFLDGPMVLVTAARRG